MDLFPAMLGHGWQDKAIQTDFDRRRQGGIGTVGSVAHSALSRGATLDDPVGISRRRKHLQYRSPPRNDTSERFEMGGEGIGGGADGGAERQLPPPQRAGDWRRCQSLGGACGVLETEGSGLCGGSLEPAGA